MKPAFRIEADGQDVTGGMNDRLLSLRITDQAGMKSDRLELLIDDRDNRVEAPRTGAKIKIWIGYRETGLSYMGMYVVDEVTFSGVPEQISIRARAADMRESFKSQKTRQFESKTIGAIVGQIAGENGLSSRVSKSLSGITIKYLAQTEESDLNLLTRLARQYDAVSKPADGKLLFVKRGEAKSASGKDLKMGLHRTKLIRWNCSLKDRAKYKSVKASWHDKDKAQSQTEEAGSGDPAYKLRHPYPDKDQAKKACEAKKKELDRGTGKFSCETIGDPAIAAEMELEISGVRDGVNGKWTITTATHNLNSGGYRTSIQAEIKKS